MRDCFYLVLFICFLFFTACSTTKKTVADKSVEKDSVIITYKTETTYVTDTTYIELPAQTAERTTKDSCSFLQNDYAESTARINTDGTLYHDLILLPKTIPKTFEKPVITKSSDTNANRSQKVTITKTVEKPIPFWTRFFALLGKILSITIILSLFIYNIKHKKLD